MKSEDRSMKTEDKRLKSEVDVEQVITVYRTYHPRSCPGDKERRLIASRLSEGSTAEDLKKAIDGCHVSPYHCGQNTDNRKYQTLELIMRDASKVTQFCDLLDDSNQPVLSAKTQKGMTAVQNFLARKAGENGSQRSIGIVFDETSGTNQNGSR